jgi:hypothetical protein
MTDYETIRKDIYESFHDTFHKLYISELKDQIADKDEVITSNDHVIAEQQAEIERLNNIIQTMRYAEDEDKINVSMENERLKEKCDKQAMVIRRMFVEEFPDTWFAWHGYGEKDRNGLPQYIEVVPAHGVGWTQVYERTERTISMEGS